MLLALIPRKLGFLGKFDEVSDLQNTEFISTLKISVVVQYNKGIRIYLYY